MTFTALLLILASACTHVGWNTLGKRRHPNLAFFVLACGCGGTLMLPVALWHGALVREIPVAVWRLLLFTGFWQAVYLVGLAGAYRHGHLSMAYPLARALPVLMITLISAVRAHAELSPALYIGGALVVFGALLLPLPAFRAWGWHHYRNRSCAFALLAALGTVGYSLTDDHALRLLREAAGEVSGPFSTSLVYGCLEGLSAFLWLLPLVLIRRGHRKDGRAILRDHPRTPFLAGVAMYGGYALILIAYAYVDDVAYAVAFRQVSIPLGALVGVLFLKEPALGPKIAGVGLLFGGLLLTALG